MTGAKHDNALTQAGRLEDLMAEFRTRCENTRQKSAEVQASAVRAVNQARVILRELRERLQKAG
jgi:hypothetical protein